MIIKIASYNMSWASAMGIVSGSEKNFVFNALKHYQKKGIQHNLRLRRERSSREPGLPGSRREPRDSGSILWQNALDLLSYFWSNQKPDVVGLQEIVSTKIWEITNNLALANDKFEFAYCTIQSINNSLSTVLTVWRIKNIGSRVHMFSTSLDKINGGRPFLVVFTSNGYTLINIHAPNNPKDSNNNMLALRKSLNTHIGEAIDDYIANSKDTNRKKFLSKYKPQKILFMGDFNDPHNTINDYHPLTIKWGNTLVSFKNGTPNGIKSCCYNFKTSCLPKDYNNTPLPQTKFDIFTNQPMYAEPYECFIREDETLQNNIPKSLSRKKFGDQRRGQLDTYIASGDYCLGMNVVQPLTIYRPLPFVHTPNISLESDHELVYAIFSTLVH